MGSSEADLPPLPANLDSSPEPEAKLQPPSVSFKEFFERIPPGSEVTISKPYTTAGSASHVAYKLNLPALELHCDTDMCNGARIFEPTGEHYLRLGDFNLTFALFRCRNCTTNLKIYALIIPWERGANGAKGPLSFKKLGELPPFGPQTPAKLMSLVGPEREYFLKGRRAENQGLGIAAYAYYRRVVESQKNRILDKIIQVSQKLDASGVTQIRP